MPIDEVQDMQPVEAALEWASGVVEYNSSHRLTNHPWAKTYALEGEGMTSYLKIVPADGAGARRALNKIAGTFTNSVPEMIDSDLAQGFFLFRDFDGQPIEGWPNASIRKSILSAYGQIQEQAIDQTWLKQDLPNIRCADQFEAFMKFLDGGVDRPAAAPSLDGAVTASYFLGRKAAQQYRNMFSAVAPLFERFLQRGDALPSTINHCDLRTKNVASRADGSLIIYDWDNAVCAPPGLSLHALFSGCERILAALWNLENHSSSDRIRRDRQAIEGYVDALCASKWYRSEKLLEALPSVACAGVIHYLMGFADYPVESRSLRRTIGKNMSRRFSDLLNVAHLLLLKEGTEEEKHAFSMVLRDSGRSKRADRLERDAGMTPPLVSASNTSQWASSPGSNADDAWLQAKLKQSDAQDVVPSVAISSSEQEEQRLSDRNRLLGVELFKRHGTLMIKNAIPIDLVQRCHAEFMAENQRYFETTKHEDALRVGNRRLMITVEFKDGFADPKLFASPFVTPIMSELLSPDFVLGSLTAVASLPGSADQRLHKDNQALFSEVPDGMLPSFSIAMIVPLIPLNDETGTTRVVKGSHRHSSAVSKTMPYQDPMVELGSCFFMDSRLTHMGRANKSERVRPITSIVYQRPWYHDNLNYKKQKPLNINSQQFDVVPTNLKKLVDWAL